MLASWEVFSEFDYHKKALSEAQRTQGIESITQIIPKGEAYWVKIVDMVCTLCPLYCFWVFYKSQEGVFLVFVSPYFLYIRLVYISFHLQMLFSRGWFELWTQYPESVVPLAMLLIGISFRKFPENMILLGGAIKVKNWDFVEKQNLDSSQPPTPTHLTALWYFDCSLLPWS